MGNQFFIVNTTQPLMSGEVEKEFTGFMEILDSGYEIKRCYMNESIIIFHLTEVEEEEAIEEPLVESVVEIALDDNPLTVKEWTDDGWTVKAYYSKKVQLVKMKEVE